MVSIGVRAAPMVALTAFSVGVTLAMQAAHSLESLGAEIYIPDLVMITLLREMGPVLIAVIVIGRSGSAVAAELGTMKVSEEIEALEVMAINPVQYLVVPRFLAMMVMLPALTIFGNYIGILGGWAVCVSALDFNTAGYVLRALESVHGAQRYLDAWASDEHAWLRKYYPADSDEVHYDLTPATERAIDWVVELGTRRFVGTESRLMAIFDLLHQLVQGTELDRSYTVNTQSLTNLVPTLNYSSANPRNTSFTIRGLGSSVVAVAAG